MTAPSSPSRKLETRLTQLATRLREVESAQRTPQLGYSSLQGGMVPVYDAEGVLRQMWGVQPSGAVATVNVNGPPPPRPPAPNVTPVLAGLDIAWTGELIGETPDDFARITVHGSYVPNFVWSQENRIGTLYAAGSLVMAPLEVAPYYVRFVAWNTSNKHSEPSLEASGIAAEVVADSIVDGIVTELKLAEGAVTAAKLAAQAVTGAKIADGAVADVQLATEAVTAAKLAAAAVTGPAIAAEAVTAASIAAGAVVAGKIATGAVTAETIVANAITTAKIAAGAVTAQSLAAVAVTAEKIAAGAVVAEKIAASAVTADKIAALAITADKIAANAIDATKIVSGSVKATHLAADIALLSRLSMVSPQGVETVVLDGRTGNVTMIGEFKTAMTGERISMREDGYNALRFYSRDGTNFSSIVSLPLFTDDSANLFLSSAPGVNGRQAQLTLDADSQVTLGTYNPSASTYPQLCALKLGLYAEITGRRTSSAASYGQIYISESQAFLTWRTSTGVARSYVVADNSQASIVGATTASVQGGGREFVFSASGTAAQILNAATPSVGIYFQSSGIDVYNPNGGAYRAVGASSFVTQSARRTKTDVTDLEFDPIDVIRRAPARSWKRAADERDEHGRFRRTRKQIGPMADDLPESLQVRMQNPGGEGEELGIDLGDNIGVAWAAIARQADTIDALVARLDALEVRETA